MRTAWSSLAGIGIGAILGVWFIQLPSRKKSETEPRVRQWLEPLEAIKQFAEPSLKAEAQRLRNQLAAANAQIDATKALLDQRKQEAFFQSENGLDTLARNAEMGLLRSQHRSAVENATKAGEEVWKKEGDILADILANLKRGQLTAKGFRYRYQRTSESASLIPRDLWQLLNFDTYDQNRQTVSGGGKKYVGLQIGRNESYR